MIDQDVLYVGATSESDGALSFLTVGGQATAGNANMTASSALLPSGRSANTSSNLHTHTCGIYQTHEKLCDLGREAG